MGRKRVYIGRLPTGASTRDVEKFFRKYGTIREVDLKQGYGFVEFESSRDAEAAVHEMDGRTMDGCRVLVQMARDPGSYRRDYYGSRYRPRNSFPDRGHYRLIIKNLSSRVSWQDLKDLMRKAGEVCYVDAHRHKTHEAVVEFMMKEDMYAARNKYDGYEVNGRKLEVLIDSTHRTRRSRSRSHTSEGRSRKRRHRKSRSRSGSRSQTRSSHRSSRGTPSKRRASSTENGKQVSVKSKRRDSDDDSQKYRKSASSERNDERHSSRASSEKRHGSSHSEKSGRRHSDSREASPASGERERSFSEHSNERASKNDEKQRSCTPAGSGTPGASSSASERDDSRLDKGDNSKESCVYDDGPVTQDVSSD